MSTESALVVLIPEAESLVESFRKQYDPSAAMGVPAHVTVIYPFKSPVDLTADAIRSLEELLSTVPAFRALFNQTGRFPGVLYLSPEPVETFRRLIEIVNQRFPEAPPYGGKFNEVVPHLTVAQVSDARQLDEIASEFELETKRHLPIHVSVTNVALLDNERGRWEVRRRFPLGPNAQGS